MRHFRTAWFVLAVIITIIIGITSLLSPDVYSSPLWKIFWGIILIGIVWTIVKTKLWVKPLLFLLHISLVCMIVGGLLTSFLCVRGTLYMSPDQTIDEFVTDDNTCHKLPFDLTLQNFDIVYHDGMMTPKDFHSIVYASNGDTLRISMNKIGKIGDYRLYQTSFDEKGGSVLSVSYDPVGTPTVYLGFALFIFSGAIIISARIKKSLRIVALTLLISGTGYGTQTAMAVPAISKSKADSIARLQVVFNGEVVPFHTVATRLTYKLTGRSNVGGLSAEEFVASMLLYKDEWCKVPFIKVKSQILLSRLNAEKDYVAVNNLYDSDMNYLPGQLYEGGTGPLDSDILALDEKIELLINFWKGELFVPISSTKLVPRSDLSVESEILYNRIVPSRLLFIISIILSVVSFVLAILKCKAPLWTVFLFISALGWIAFLVKWYISAHFPLTSTYDMLEFTGTVVSTIAFLISLKYKSSLVAAILFLSIAYIYMVSWLGFKNPVMSPLMPVLDTPWVRREVV